MKLAPIPENQGYFEILQPFDERCYKRLVILLFSSVVILN